MCCSCLVPGTISVYTQLAMCLPKCPPDEVFMHDFTRFVYLFIFAALVIGHGCGKPTYGELIDIFTELEGRADTADLLYSEICRRYPDISVGRPSRLFDTIQRIVGPTRPSLRGTAKLNGSPLASYRRRVWEPRIRTKGKLIF